MELVDVMRAAGSVRRFRPEPVPLSMVWGLLDGARFAPSGGNRQGWRVVVVTDPAQRAAIGELFREGWYGLHAPLYRDSSGPDEFADHVQDVPVHLLVFVDSRSITTTIPALDGSRVVGGASIYPFVHNILLGARDRGLGTTLTTVLVTVEDRVRALLEVPDGWHLAAHLAIGWPAGRAPTRLRRRPVEQFATLGTFGGPPLVIEE
jgi:nitroreductase